MAEPTDTDFVRLAEQASDASHSNIIARFYYEPLRNNFKSTEAGRDIFEDHLFIEKMIRGQSKTVVRRAATPEDFREFPREYAAFRSGADVPVTGTPLRMLPNMSPSRVKELEFLNVRTVEEMANLNDAGCQPIMGAYELREQCRRYLAAASAQGASDLAQQVKDQAQQIAELTAQIAARPKAPRKATRRRRKYTRRAPSSEAQESA